MRTSILITCLTIACVAHVQAATSCVGRCGENDGTTGCQCNVVCVDYGDCCSDYDAVCFTCTDRCGDAYVSTAPCHCNDACPTYNNCCDDYDALCGGSTGTVTNEEILALSEELTSLDVNNVGSDIVIDMQGITTSGDTDDVAPNPLFVYVPPLTAETYTLFIALRNNYAPSVSVAEDDSAVEQGEVAAFLDAVMATPLMVRLDEFMTAKQILTGTLRENIETIWYHLYSRSGSTLGSSGFEHSFMGELDGTSVSGFHNWVSYYYEEQAGNADYKGYIEYADLASSGYVFTNRFTWNGANKPIGGYFIGTSPEFELAIYTLCFFTRPNAQCQVQSNGVQYYIQTYELASDGLTLVGSAYPGV